MVIAICEKKIASGIDISLVIIFYGCFMIGIYDAAVHGSCASAVVNFMKFSSFFFGEQFSLEINSLSRRHWQVYCSSCSLILNFKSPFLMCRSTLCLFAYLHAYQYSRFSTWTCLQLNLSHVARGRQIEWHVRPDVCFETMNNKYMCALYFRYWLLFPVQVFCVPELKWRKVCGKIQFSTFSLLFNKVFMLNWNIIVEKATESI